MGICKKKDFVACKTEYDDNGTLIELFEENGYNE